MADLAQGCEEIQAAAACRGARVLIGAGSALLCLTAAGVLLRREPLYTGIYLLAWVGYILLLDGLNARRAGHSLILTRACELRFLLPASATIWYLFELLNLRLRNWYYIQIPAWPLARWLGTAVAFATVLPLLFETVEWLEHRGFASGVRWPKWAVTDRLLAGLRLAGAACVSGVLLAPRFCFPLVWGLFPLLLEPLVYRRGGRSLLRDLAAGRPARLLQLLMAGLITGGLWELFNFWAHSKWIYTVPWFERGKLFEMPMLGFLGFPPFAVSCYVMYNAAGLARQGRTWEQPGRWPLWPRTGGVRWVGPVLAAAGACICVAGQWGIDRVTIDSYYGISRRHYPWLSGESWGRMWRDGCVLPHQLHERFARDGVAVVAKRYALPVGSAREMAEELEMVELKGMGFDNARLLREAGIQTLGDLAKADPQEVFRHLRAGHPRPWVPRPAKARLWVAAAARAMKARGDRL